MKRHTVSTLAVLAVLTLASSGCLWAPELDKVRADIERQLPGSRFEKDFAISLGPLSLGLARTIVKFVPDAREARTYLADLRRITVAVYDAHDVPEDVQLETPARLKELIERDDWELAVRAKERDEQVWVLYRTRGDTVTDLYLVALDEEELVLVRAQGRLEKLVEKAMAEDVDLGDDLGIEAY